MSSIKAINLKFNATTKSLLLFWAACFSSAVLSVQPMSEADLDGVSFDSGQNLLNIYGKPAAGLRDDTPDSTSDEASGLTRKSHQESDEAQPLASQELRSLEDEGKTPNPVELSTLDPQTLSEAIAASVETIGAASAFTTDSEIRYKRQNVHHEMSPIENGGVSVARDLSIDLLKLENLRGDDYDVERSAGSIYLSNWRSQGETRIFNER